VAVDRPMKCSKYIYSSGDATVVKTGEHFHLWVGQWSIPGRFKERTKRVAKKSCGFESSPLPNGGIER
jgi:hypothetical protein